MITSRLGLECEEVKNITRQAGALLQRFFHSRTYSVKQKAGVDFTTEADQAVDTFLHDAIAAKFPGTSFLTEETAPKDYSSFASKDAVWIIDPLDGTINFSRHNLHWSISIALVNKGVPVLAVVYIPMSQAMYWASSETKTAFCNETPLHVSNTPVLREAVIGCDWAYDLQARKNVLRWLDKLSGEVRQISSRGSAAADLAFLAEGKIDAYLHSGMKPWDVAAAAMLIEKAGGMITTPNGSPWNVFSPDILASNKILHEKILSLIK